MIICLLDRIELQSFFLNKLHVYIKGHQIVNKRKDSIMSTLEWTLIISFALINYIKITTMESQYKNNENGQIIRS